MQSLISNQCVTTEMNHFEISVPIESAYTNFQQKRKTQNIFKFPQVITI